MEKIKCLGIWMDHSKANLMECNDNDVNTQTIESEFTHQNKMEALSHSESGMQHKENQLHEQFYKKIGEEILKYNKVLLFGPTDAKLELHNFLKNNQHFNNINIEVDSVDKMTDNQQKAFVKDYFRK